MAVKESFHWRLTPHIGQQPGRSTQVAVHLVAGHLGLSMPGRLVRLRQVLVYSIEQQRLRIMIWKLRQERWIDLRSDVRRFVVELGEQCRNIKLRMPHRRSIEIDQDQPAVVVQPLMTV